jgi:hypothetical protein
MEGVQDMLINVDGLLSILLLLLLVGVGVLVFRRLFGQRHQPFPGQMTMPPQQGYGSPQGDGPPPSSPAGYGRPLYGPPSPQQSYPAQSGGINPWVAGGLGALGGGLVGYELGQAMADHEQLAPEGVLANAEPNFGSMPQGDYTQLGGEVMDVGGWDMGGNDAWGGDAGGEF